MSEVDVLRRLLVESGRASRSCTLRPLPGGVSCVVAVVQDGVDRWLAKSPLERLAVRDDWHADRARVVREAEALRFLDGRVGPLRVPRLRFVDGALKVMGMELISAPAEPWKDALLAGRVDIPTAAAVGAGMAALHAFVAPESIAGPDGEELFEVLRIDPYYRTTAVRVPALSVALERLMRDTAGAATAGRALVHGDLNPKNVLVGGPQPVLLDWEICHAGDPAFDLGMITAHLLLKASRHDRDGAATLLDAARAVWAAYDAHDGLADPGLAVRHAGGIMAARLFGKSPVDYLVSAVERDRALFVSELALTCGERSIDGLLEASGAGLSSDSAA